MNRPELAIDEHQVIQAVLAGEVEQYSVLVERYQQRLFNCVSRMVGSCFDAEDIVQDAFIQAFTKLDSFRSNSSYYTWVYRIAINTTINFCRRQRRTKSLTTESVNGEQLVASSEDAPGHRLEISEQALEVQKGLDQLSDEHRRILVLREIEDLSYEAISELLDLPIGTVRSRLHRARLQLRDCLIAAEQANSTHS